MAADQFNGSRGEVNRRSITQKLGGSSSGLPNASMRILILHLSDIHFEGDRSLAERLSKGLPAAARGILDQPTQIVLAISGDIAFSGKRDEYARAGAFLDQLVASLESLSGSPVNEVLVPGNHDCDFSGPQTVRDLVLREARAFADNHQPLDRSLVDVCLSPQEGFFEFVGARGSPVSADQRINYVRSLAFDGFTVVFNCINTAWGSQLHERQAQLVLPLSALTEPLSDGIVISVFHHPFNWFSADNGRALRASLEKWSDMILTGHEHAGAGYLKAADDGLRTIYSEGNVLQTSHGAAGGFNAVVVDTTSKQYRVLRHQWKDDLYTPVIADPPWFDFARDLRGRVGKFRSTDNFSAFLSDAGAAFSHPARADLRLADIVIYPDLRRLNYDKGDPPVGRFIAGESVPAFITSRPTHLILGDEKAGKTSLAKSLYLELQRRRVVPLLLKGSEFMRYKKGRLQAIVDAAVARQYAGDVAERYRQLEPGLKAILVDDIDQARLTKARQHTLAAELERLAGTVVLFAMQDYQLDTMTQRPGEEDALLKYTRSSIMELGYKLRGRLIEKWVNLGEPAATDEEMSRVIGGIEQTVTGLLGRNLLPSYPLFVLIILQSYEAQNVLRTTAGSLGYYYEILIFTALQGKTALITFDTLMTFIAGAAYWLLQQKKKWLASEELEELADRYETEYKLRLPRETLLKVLADARILKPAGDKTLRFNYRYVYCYFVAKFIATNLNSAALGAGLRAEVSFLASRLYVEDFANIVIFLVYLTKDEATIEELLKHARELYANESPVGLDADPAVVVRLGGDHPRILLPTGEARAHQEEYRAELDALDASKQEEEIDAADEREIEGILRLNVAFKSVRILGQILRNFPGALRGDLKLEIAKECFSLGRRTLGYLLRRLDENLEPTRVVIAEALVAVRGIRDPDGLALLTDSFLATLIRGGGYGIVRRVAQAVGSEHLAETFRELVSTDPCAIVELIDVAIKLDHSLSFPESEVSALYERLDRRVYSGTILRWMVRDHLYLYPVDYKARQRVCDQLKIDAAEPRMITDGSKKR